jgi:hypothetical protein
MKSLSEGQIEKAPYLRKDRRTGLNPSSEIFASSLFVHFERKILISLQSIERRCDTLAAPQPLTDPIQLTTECPPPVSGRKQASS